MQPSKSGILCPLTRLFRDAKSRPLPQEGRGVKYAHNPWCQEGCIPSPPCGRGCRERSDVAGEGDLKSQPVVLYTLLYRTEVNIGLLKSAGLETSARG